MIEEEEKRGVGKRGPGKKNLPKYRTLDEVPEHCFWDRSCYLPVTKDLHEYLTYLLTHYPESLRYIYQEVNQKELIELGHMYHRSFPKWLKGLESNLKRLEGSYEL